MSGKMKHFFKLNFPPSTCQKRKKAGEKKFFHLLPSGFFLSKISQSIPTDTIEENILAIKISKSGHKICLENIYSQLY